MALATAVLLAAGAGCAAEGPPTHDGSTAATGPTGQTPTIRTASSTTPSAIAPPKRAPRPKPVVVLISVDGLNPTAITQLDARGKVPSYRALLAGGASTLNARTSYEQTNTLPNHTGMLTGRPITGPTGTHVTFNVEHRGNLRSLNGHYIPGVFDPVHDAGLSTGFYAEKTKFDFLVRSWNAAGGARDVTGRNDGKNKLTVAEVNENADRVLADAVARLRANPPNLTFLHLKAADEAGHHDKVNGFMGPKYLAAVVQTDKQVGKVFAAIRASPKLKGRTTVILTADHGGRGTDASSTLGHRNPKLLDNYRIPFLVWGPGVPAHANLYRLNPGRRDPGTARVGYGASKQPIRNFDATNLILGIFGLRALPDTRPRGLPALRSR